MSFRDAIDLAGTGAEKMLRALEDLQQRIARRVAALVSEMESDEMGRVSATNANAERIQSILAQAKAEFADEEFVDAVTEYLASFDAISKEVQESAGRLSQDAVDRQRTTAINRAYKLQLATYLLDPETYNSTIWRSVSSSLLTSMASLQRKKQAAIDAAESVASVGLLAAIGAEVASGPTQLQRAQTKAAADGMGAEFFLYQGRPIKTTRKFCAEREGRVWHRAEIEKWGSDAAAGVDLDGNGKPGWAGMVEGTNASTIFVFLGGWYGERNSCRHVLVPVELEDVPQEDLARMRAQGLVDL